MNAAYASIVCIMYSSMCLCMCVYISFKIWGPQAHFFFLIVVYDQKLLEATGFEKY